MEICLLLKFTKKKNKALEMEAQMMVVNNFFGHWFTDIDIRRYPDDTRILPTSNSVDIYQYSNVPVHLDKDVDRRPNNNEDDNKHSDPNLTY